MLTVANNEPQEVRNLPVAPNRPISAEYPLKVRGLLDLPSLAGSEVLAGATGLDQLVSRINVMEVPDILPWVKPHELLLTTGFSLRDAETGHPFEADALVELVTGLADREVAAFGIKAGRYLDDLPDAVLAAADRLGFPILRLPEEVAFDDVMSDVFTQLVDRQAWALDVADRLHRALTAIVLGGGDQPQIAEEFASLFGAAVLICTLDGRVQTMAGDESRGRGPARARHVRPVGSVPDRIDPHRPAAGPGRGRRVGLARRTRGGGRGRGRHRPRPDRGLPARRRAGLGDRAGARAGRDRHRAGHHQATGGVGGRVEVSRRLPARRVVRHTPGRRRWSSITAISSAGMSTVRSVVVVAELDPLADQDPRRGRGPDGGRPLAAGAVQRGLAAGAQCPRQDDPGRRLQPRGGVADPGSRPGTSRP